MSGFEWEFFRRERGQRQMTTRQWLAEQPLWVKAMYLFVVLPAWVLIVVNMFTGQSKNWSSIVAFGVIFAVALVLIVVDHRRKSSAPNG